MLAYLGAQRTVKNVQGSAVSTYKYPAGPITSPVNALPNLSNISSGYSLNTYNSAKCFFMSRGLGEMYADTMAAFAIDIATSMGITTQKLLETMTQSGMLTLEVESYRIFNILRSNGNQVGKATSVSNSSSIQAREIRS